MTPIDSIYKFAGMKFAGAFYEALSDVWVPVIVALSGMAFLVHTIADHGQPRRLVVHVLYLCLMGWLISPKKVSPPQGGEFGVPRFIYYFSTACEGVQIRAIEKIDVRFLDGPFRFERIAAGAAAGRVFDPDLALDLQEFEQQCHQTTLVYMYGNHPTQPPEAAGHNPLRPLSGYAKMSNYGPRAAKGKQKNSVPCEEQRQALEKRVRDHLKDHPHHKEILGLAQKHDPGNLAAFKEAYYDQMVSNTLDSAGSYDGNAFVRRTLGTQALYPSVNVGKAHPDEGITDRLERVAGEFLDMMGSTTAVLSQWWSDQFTARQKYYIVTTQAPYIYGFALMLLLAFFPVIGVWALLPGKWTALVNYGKVFVSINLWPLGWALLSSFTSHQPSTKAFDPTTFGQMDLWMAVVSMYLATPVFCFAMISLLATAGGHAFVTLSAAPAGPGAGPIGAIASGVGRHLSSARSGR